MRRLESPTPSDIRSAGIDEFAWLKCQRYDSYDIIICGLQRRRTIDFLPDREGATVADWLAAYPGIEIACRDCDSCYRKGAEKGTPQSLQVADRWHLLGNATAAFVEAVKWHVDDLRRVNTGEGVDAEALSSAEQKQ